MVDEEMRTYDRNVVFPTLESPRSKMLITGGSGRYSSSFMIMSLLR